MFAQYGERQCSACSRDIIERNSMGNFLLGVTATAALLSSSFGAAKADPSPQLIFGVDRAGDAASLVPVQFIFGGHNFCWYDSGWQGPGFYWCGYATRRGLGWGGGDGFNGWHGGHGAVGGGARVGAGHVTAQRAPAGAARPTAARGDVAHTAAHPAADHGGGDKKPGE
jgi:hypothetical protein